MTFGLIASLDRMFPYLKTLFKENNMKKLLVFALFLGLGTSAYAQSPMGGKLETGLNFSYGMPMDKDMKDSVKASPIYGLFADYQVVDNVFVGAEYGFGEWKAKEGDGKMKENIIGLRAKYELPIQDGLKVYGLLGIAQYNYKWDGGEKDDGIGFNLGVGAKYDVAENVFVGLDIRYHFAPKFEQKWYDEYEDEWYTEKYKTNHMMIGINAGYRF